MTESENNQDMPSKLFVHLTFWGMHLTFILLIATGATEAESADTMGVVVMFACLIFLFWYVFAIGRYASKSGRSGIIWEGLSFFFSPVGIWVSYIASFFVGHKSTE